MGRKQARRRDQPTTRCIRGAGGRLTGGVDQQLEGILVTGRRERLNVVRPGADGRVGGLQGCGCAGVGADPPTAGSAVIHGAAHDRMAKAESSGRGGGADQVELEQLIEGREHRRDVLLGDRADELGFERVAGDRGRPQGHARLPGNAPELLLDGRDHRTRDGFRRTVRSRPLAASPRGTRTRQLLDVERVAAALAVEARSVNGIDIAGDQRLRVLAAERHERQQSADTGARGSLKLSEEPRRRLSKRNRHQQWAAEATQQVRQHLDRAGVGPVHVIEGQHQRLAPRQPLEHAADRVMQPVALRALARGA